MKEQFNHILEKLNPITEVFPYIGNFRFKLTITIKLFNTLETIDLGLNTYSLILQYHTINLLVLKLGFLKLHPEIL